MDQLDAGIALMQALPRGFAAMRRAVVHNPEQAGSGTIRFLRQDLVYQPPKRLDAGRRRTPTHNVSPAHLPGGQILQRTPALVLMLDAGRSAWRGGPGRMAAVARLNAGLLVGPEDVVLGAEGLALPSARIQVQNRSGLLRKAGISGKDPVLVAPGLDGIGRQQPPYRAPTDRFTQRVLGSSSHASDCRLRGCLVSATSSQATALTSAWSRGGKTGVTPPSQLIVQGEVPLGPSLPPMADGVRVQPHPSGRLPIGEARLGVKSGGPSWRVGDVGT
jgi:hypothetical protein